MYIKFLSKEEKKNEISIIIDKYKKKLPRSIVNIDFEFKDEDEYKEKKYLLVELIFFQEEKKNEKEIYDFRIYDFEFIKFNLDLKNKIENLGNIFIKETYYLIME